MTRGVRLAKVWRYLLLRRIFFSRISFDEGRMIGENLSRVQGALINCSHTGEEHVMYQRLEDELTHKLIIAGSTSDVQKKPRWSLATYRQLTMLSMWSLLPKLDRDFNLKAVNMKTTLEQKYFFLDWFRDQIPYPNPAQPADMLIYLCTGAPKLRALLRNIRSQVSTPRGRLQLHRGPVEAFHIFLGGEYPGSFMQTLMTV